MKIEDLNVYREMMGLRKKHNANNMDVLAGLEVLREGEISLVLEDGCRNLFELFGGGEGEFPPPAA